MPDTTPKVRILTFAHGVNLTIALCSRRHHVCPRLEDRRPRLRRQIIIVVPNRRTTYVAGLTSTRMYRLEARSRCQLLRVQDSERCLEGLAYSHGQFGSYELKVRPSSLLASVCLAHCPP